MFMLRADATHLQSTSSLLKKERCRKGLCSRFWVFSQIKLWSVVQRSVFSKHIGDILSWSSGLCANKDLVLYIKIIKVNVVCARTMQPFNLETLFC